MLYFDVKEKYFSQSNNWYFRYVHRMCMYLDICQDKQAHLVTLMSSAVFRENFGVFGVGVVLKL